MRVLEVFGDICALFGVALAGVGGWLAATGRDMTQAAGKLWFTLDSAGLNTFQAVVQRRVHPGLWDNVIVPVLQRPAWEAITVVAVLSIVAGVALVVFARGWGRRHRRRRVKSRIN